MGATLKWVNDKLIERGWTQGELARRSGLSTATISRVLSGKDRPGLKFYAGISQAFRIPIGEVIRLSRGATVPETYLQLAEISKEISKDDQQVLLEFALYLYQKRAGAGGENAA